MDTDQKIGELIPFKGDHKKEEAESPAKEDDKKKGVAPPAIHFYPTKNIVLVGRTGAGKSATGNSICGLKAFPLRTKGSAVTMTCQSGKRVTNDGMILNVIDTPGLFDISVSAEFIGKEIGKCLSLANGAVHAVLLVLPVMNRVSKEDEMVLSSLQLIFGSKIYEYLIIVFSGGDLLEDYDVTLDEYLEKNCTAFLKNVLTVCGNRKILFDNKTKDEEKKTKQVDDLLNLIDLVREQNNNKPYTDEMYNKIKEVNDTHKKEEAEPESSRDDFQIRKENLIAMPELFEQMDTDQKIGEPIRVPRAKEDYKKKDAAPPRKKDHKDDHGWPFLPFIGYIGQQLKGIKGSKLPSATLEDDEGAESSTVENIVLVGRTGNGKSATGNSIVGDKGAFFSKTQGSGVTMKCKSMRGVTPENRILNVIDTPGLCDLSVSADFIATEIVNCLGLADGGLHAVLLVLTVRTRLSEEEEKVLTTLQNLFGSKICEYLIVVFTGEDVLLEEGSTLDIYLGDNSPDFLKRVLKLCGDRKMVFDNKTTDKAKMKKQVHELIKLIDKVKKQNKNRPYTDKMYYKIKEVNDKHKREQLELELRGHTEKELNLLRSELQRMHEQNLKAMSDLVAENIKLAMAAEEKEKQYLDKFEVMRKELEDQKDGCTIL